jgi:hypothetical protein
MLLLSRLEEQHTAELHGSVAVGLERLSENSRPAPN